MSSTLRLSIIMVLLLATAALGLIAYSHEPAQTSSTGHGEHSGAGASHRRVLCRGTSATERYIGPRRRFRSTLGAVG